VGIRWREKYRGGKKKGMIREAFRGGGRITTSLEILLRRGVSTVAGGGGGGGVIHFSRKKKKKKEIGRRGGGELVPIITDHYFVRGKEKVTIVGSRGLL